VHVSAIPLGLAQLQNPIKKRTFAVIAGMSYHLMPCYADENLFYNCPGKINAKLNIFNRVGI